MTTLLVASTGGHLKQLHRLHRRLEGVEGPFRWATFDTPQSRSLLTGEALHTSLDHHLALSGAQALAWTVGLLVASSMIFERRDLS